MANTINPTGLFLATALAAAGQLIHGWHPFALGLSICLYVVTVVAINDLMNNKAVRGIPRLVMFVGILGFAMFPAVFAMPWMVG